MNNFEEFKTDFDNTFGSIEQFIDIFGEKGSKLINAELKQNNDENVSGSYDYTDEILKRVFYFPGYDIFILFEGRNTSYVGEGWNSMKEVKPKQETGIVYE